MYVSSHISTSLTYLGLTFVGMPGGSTGMVRPLKDSPGVEILQM